MTHNLNALKGCYQGLQCRELLQGLLLGMLGVSTIPQIRGTWAEVVQAAG